MLAINYLIFMSSLCSAGIIIRHFHIKKLEGGLI